METDRQVRNSRQVDGMAFAHTTSSATVTVYNLCTILSNVP